MDHHHQKNQIPQITQELKNIPHSPGVYLYRNDENQIIYVGKAVDLNKRVHQYFQNPDKLDRKTAILVNQITHIETIRTLSEFDALLLEAKLINQYQPKYNILAKDDKSPLYILITFSDKLPYISLVRKKQLKIHPIKKSDAIYGPFQSAKTTRDILRTLRHIIPFCIEKKRNGKPCFYTQIGLCNPCPSQITGMTPGPEKTKQIKIYRQHLYRLKRILSGDSAKIVLQLEKEMHDAASNNRFEESANIRDKMFFLQSLILKRFDPMIYTSKTSLLESSFSEESSQLKQILLPHYPYIKDIHRIECYDISNIVGKSATGSMVVMIDNLYDTSQYRKIRIKFTSINDFAMMQEVLERRLKHQEWPYPDLILIDGGKGQVNAAYDVILKNKIVIPVIGLAKRQEEIVLPTEIFNHVIRLPLNNPSLQMLERIRDEAHRFAITYHRLLRKKNFLK